MTTTVKDNPAEQRYEIRVDGVVAGYSAYDSTATGSRSPTPKSTTHTPGKDWASNW